MLSSERAGTATQTKVDYKLVPFGGGVVPDSQDIAALHAELLPRSPLTKIGTRFMEDFYYKSLPRQGAIFGAVAYVDGEAAGFIAATYDSNNFLALGMRRNFYRLLWIGLTTLPTYSRIEGAVEASGIMKYREGRDRRDGTENVGEILSVGVRVPYRRPEFKKETGIEIGRDLMLGAMDAFGKSKLTRARLIVDSNDIHTQNFYRRLGWQPRRRSVPGWLTPSTEFVWIPR